MPPEPGARPITLATSTELLQELRDARNATAWQHYADRYRPLVVSYARRLGLGAEDAEDAAQQTLLAFSAALREGKYDRAAGRLRTWLFGIAHRCACSLRRARAREQQRSGGAGAEALEDASDEGRWQELWEQEWRDALVQRCLEVVRGEVEATTFEAFRMLVWDELPAAAVAARTGLSENAVYGAKRRVLARIRELLPLVEEAY